MPKVKEFISGQIGNKDKLCLIHNHISMKKLLYKLTRAVSYSFMGMLGQLLFVGLSFGNDDPKKIKSIYETGIETVYKTTFRAGVSADIDPSTVITTAVIDISGSVTSSIDGEGIPGVNILVKGTGTGTVTDVEGNYSLHVPNENDTLVF